MLWAFTSNFSTVQAYDLVVSDPIIVPARELGTNIPRAKLFTNEVTCSSRLKREALTSLASTSASPSTSVLTSNSQSTSTKTVYQDFMQVIASAENEGLNLAKKRKCGDEKVGGEFSQSQPQPQVVQSKLPLSTVELSHEDNMTDESQPLPVDHIVCSPAAATAAEPTVVVCASISGVTSRESIESLQSEHSQSFPGLTSADDNDDDSNSNNNNSFYDTIMSTSELGGDLQDRDPGSYHQQPATHSSARFGSSEALSSNSKHYLDPNEPVFTGCKQYAPHCIFWQV